MNIKDAKIKLSQEKSHGKKLLMIKNEAVSNDLFLPQGDEEGKK